MMGENAPQVPQAPQGVDAAMTVGGQGWTLEMPGNPRQVSPAQLAQWSEETDYSEKYCDDVYEYRRVTVPRSMLPALPADRCMTEQQWRNVGITMSRGWQHYDHHAPEANVLLFRRVLGTDPKTGQVPPDMAKKVSEREAYIFELEQMRQGVILEQVRRQEHPGMEHF